MTEAPDKWLCEDCGTVTLEENLLKAAHPFEPDETICGCPNCNGLDLARACQHGACSHRATSGHPGGYGYRFFWSCWEHSLANPKNVERIND